MARVKIIVECSEQTEGKKSRYITSKNRDITSDRLEVLKFNKELGKYTLHKEI